MAETKIELGDGDKVYVRRDGLIVVGPREVVEEAEIADAVATLTPEDTDG